MVIILGLVIFASALALIGYCIKDVGKGNGVRPPGGKIGAIVCVSISGVITLAIFIFALMVKDKSLIIGALICIIMIASMINGILAGNFDDSQ